ncbi:adenylate/guanylate cyclase domain-containing protein [Nocardia sp. NBC_01009]|uniref:adenylate/guanylate cyclase domain-containing protein n=1 Tax=Nocardia sp. NBC_01009 TaxID=2975996 RepID=UPI003865B6C7|nr:HAMP domain-containing protein [Nocardia sp. NBC_01009]
MIAKLVVWALRARWGLAAVVITCNLSGLAVIVTELWLSGFFHRLGPDTVRAMALVAVYPAVGFLAGIALAIRDRTVYFGWLDDGRKPTPEEARRLLRLPIAITTRALALWLPGVIISAAALSRVTPQHDLAVMMAMFVLGGFESAALTFLIVDRLIRPTIPIVTAVLGATMHWSSTVFVRVVLTWVVSGAMPLLMLIVVLADPVSGASDRIRTGIYVAAVGIGVGALATATLARAVAAPLRMLRRALDRITHGELDVRVPIGSASEIGRLEHSVNELATNLRERMRMREVFGRHVGAEVAERALARGVDLTGDVRVVAALFVDVTGSVELSTGLPPQEFVAKLNRLLSTVVAATEANNGLVNKFEGDAALCIFGAPIALRDNATPALRAARRIRDEVVAAGELDIGIGVALGLVFAGDVGSDTRLEYTVIGDAVNEAARLTTEAKEVPRRILVSGTVIEAAADDERAEWTLYESIRLRGMKEPTACWTDIDPTGSTGHPAAGTEHAAAAIAKDGATPVSAVTEIRCTAPETKESNAVAAAPDASTDPTADRSPISEIRTPATEDESDALHVRAAGSDAVTTSRTRGEKP